MRLPGQPRVRQHGAGLQRQVAGIEMPCCVGQVMLPPAVCGQSKVGIAAGGGKGVDRCCI